MLNSIGSWRTGLLLTLIVALSAALPGCTRRSEMAHVRGKVLYKDGSVPQGGMCVVRFQPAATTTAKTRKGASSNIGPDGSFDLWTRKPGDGVYLGEYEVSFAVWQSPTEPKSLIMAKYTSAATSGYKVTVDKDLDDLKYEIEPLPGAAATKAAP